MEMLIGKFDKEGSIYGVCNKGKLECFEDAGKADQPNPKVSCKKVEGETNRKLGVYEPHVHLRWPKGILCYKPLSTTVFSASLRANFTSAVNIYHTKTSIKIITLDEWKIRRDRRSVCGNCQNYVKVIDGSGCWSKLGYRKIPAQELSLNTTECGTISTAIHELGHALGLIHEHKHMDSSLIPIQGNIPITGRVDWRYQLQRAYDANALPYDTMSAMGYPLTAFGNIWLCEPKDPTTRYCDTLESPATTECKIATVADCKLTANINSKYARQMLSTGDVATLERMYKWDNANLKVCVNGWRHWWNKKISLRTYHSFKNIRNVETCRAKCYEDTGVCKSFSYSHRGLKCDLKKDVLVKDTSLVTDFEFSSGEICSGGRLRAPCVNNWRTWKNTMLTQYAYSVLLLNEHLCALSCRNDINCRAFSWTQQKTGTCWLIGEYPDTEAKLFKHESFNSYGKCWF